MEELDLKEFFYIFWNKKLVIIIVTILFAVIGAGYSYTCVKPMYKSSTTLLLTKTEESSDATQTITQSDLTLNQKLVSTYSELIKRKSILSETLSRLNIPELTENSLKNNVSVKSVNSTELIEITVNNENPTYAARIANEIAEVFTEKVREIYNINNIYVVDEAEPNNTPYNINHTKDIVMFAMIGILLACSCVFIINILDTTLKSPKDIEQLVDLPVLVSIPVDNKTSNKGGNE